MGLNAAIYDEASGRIIAFLFDATRIGKGISGHNGRYVIGSKTTGVGVFWTEDEVLQSFAENMPVFTPDNISELTESAIDRDIGTPDRADLLNRIDRLRDMAKTTDAKIETYIGNNVTDLSSARSYLIRLTKETRDILRIVLFLMKSKV